MASSIGAVVIDANICKVCEASMLNPTPPSSSVLRRFGVEESPSRLPGGQGVTWQAGGIVLKPVQNEPEAEWIAEVLTTLKEDGFRIPRPISAHGGRWVCDGWAAFTKVEGEHRKGCCEEKLSACRAFHSALLGISRPSFFDARDDAWAVADRAAWGEVEVIPYPEVKRLLTLLKSLMRPISLPSQIIHGDFGGNTLFANGQSIAVIDFSAYWRPAAFAEAVIVIDTMLWEGLGEEGIEIASGITEGYQMMIRAVLRRVIEMNEIYRRTGQKACLDEVVSHHSRVVDLIAMVPLTP